MNQQPRDIRAEFQVLKAEKFIDPDRTASGEQRAEVVLARLSTLWINTGTLCNITCKNCYIDSSPTNDSLSYFSLDDARVLFDEIGKLSLTTCEIGFTGGEPFMNPQAPEMMEEALLRGFDVLVLTNAMQPMMRPKVKNALLDLNSRFPGKIVLRVSLDHYSERLHEIERGKGSWGKALEGLDWLTANGFQVAIAGRTCWGENEEQERKGYERLIRAHKWPVNAANPGELVLFPEMNEQADVPEITVSCWGILGKSAADLMCAASRMVVKRKGADQPSIMPCTLLPYDKDFDMGQTLEQSIKANGGNFRDGAVKLNHPHCSKFCVLGGGSCSL